MTPLSLAVAVAGTVVVIAQPWLVLISGSLIPALTALVTKDVRVGWLQVLLLAFLSAVAGVIAQTTTGAFPLRETIMTIVATAAIAFFAHYGYAVSGLLGKINVATKPFGIGPRLRPGAIPPHGAINVPVRGTAWFDDPAAPPRRQRL